MRLYQEVLKFDRELETEECEQLSADVAPGSRCGWTRHCGVALSPTMGHLDMKQYATLGDHVVLTQLGHGEMGSAPSCTRTSRTQWPLCWY